MKVKHRIPILADCEMYGCRISSSLSACIVDFPHSHGHMGFTLDGMKYSTFARQLLVGNVERKRIKSARKKSLETHS